MREDVRNAVRSLLQAPTFTGVALLVLALGIGASTAIFSVVDAVILKGLPFDEHDRLVAVLEHDTRHPTTFGNGEATPQTYLYWREHQQAFEYLVGLVIAAAGLYGVMAYTVAQRTGEIGVRMALGATPANVVGMVLRQAARLTAAGLIIGIAGAWYLGASVRAFLFQVEATDSGVFGLSLLVLAAAGLIASIVPARRAARVDPLIALRSE